MENDAYVTSRDGATKHLTLHLRCFVIMLPIQHKFLRD